MKDIMIKGLLFDMDGVLVDNLDVHKRAFRLFFSRYGVDKSIEELSRMFGKGNDDIMRELMPAEVVERVGLRELGYEKEAIYREIYATTIAPTRGLTEFLSECRRRGLKCAVGSSGCMANVDFVLDGCGIRDSFEAVVAGDRVRRCKPDPEIYLTAAAALGLAPAECIVFEDAEAGIVAGKRAGMKVVALSTTFPADFLRDPSADLIVADFTQVDIDMLVGLAE